MALIIHASRRLGIEVFIESGRARAQSTWMLSTFLPDVLIHSVEMRDDADARFGVERCAFLPNVTLHQGPGEVLLPHLASQAAPRRTAILCDGPKGAAAVAIVEQCFQHPHVIVGFIHDMRRLDHGEPSPHRAAALSAFPDARFSDDPRITQNFAWMDQAVFAGGGSVGPLHEQEFGSYGPTVGVFCNPSTSNKQSEIRRTTP